MLCQGDMGHPLIEYLITTEIQFASVFWYAQHTLWSATYGFHVTWAMRAKDSWTLIVITINYATILKRTYSFNCNLNHAIYSPVFRKSCAGK